MSENTCGVADVEDRERLVEEISMLRGKVARLQERVEQLDQLAHQDSLIDLPNRPRPVRGRTGDPLPGADAWPGRIDLPGA